MDRIGKVNVEEVVRGAERMLFSVPVPFSLGDSERVVNVAWVLAGRTLGFGRRLDGGMVIVREEAVVVAAWRRGSSRSKLRADGRNMVGWWRWRCWRRFVGLSVWCWVLGWRRVNAVEKLSCCGMEMGRRGVRRSWVDRIAHLLFN